jgi:hypothetical protein
MDEFHRIPYVDHPRYQKMVTTTRKLYYWLRMKHEIVEYITNFLECQQVKVDHKHIIGLQQCFPIPEWKWKMISMDFIIGLTKTFKQYDEIMVVVDKLR